MDLKSLISACESAGEQWANDVFGETEPAARGKVQWTYDESDGSFVTAEGVVRAAGSKWDDVPEESRQSLCDAVMTGAAREWAALRSTEAGQAGRSTL